MTAQLTPEQIAAIDDLCGLPYYLGRAVVFGYPEHYLDRLQRYLRKGLDQRIAALAAWGWVSFTREHNALAVEAAQAWGEVADLVEAYVDKRVGLTAWPGQLQSSRRSA